MTGPKTKDGWLIKYINDIRAEERERCAKVADEEARLWAQDCVADVPEAMQTLAADIRALGDE